ncbi:MAG TPA: glycosyltransferase family 87 protein [Gaiellaceae bacterium]|jgi:hypothetical protein|nr:glycosyltransferase family 87 protein [Gaiellaceae bacterium]
MARRLCDAALIAGLGAAMVWLADVEITAIVGEHGIGSDFAGTIYYPAVAVVHGLSPYGYPGTPTHLAGSVYPPSAFVSFAWLGLMGHSAAVAVWITLMVAAAVATLYLLGVRDPRCYALWLLNPMALSTIAIGNATILVILLVAVAWRWRDSPWVTGLALAAAVAVKFFVAPLVIWMLATKRYKAAAVTTLTVPVAVLTAWATVGFSGITRYPSILSMNDSIFSSNGPFLQGFVLQEHGSSHEALAAGIVAAFVLLIGAWFVGDLGGFTLAICASIILAPVAWIGYAGLLVIPLAVASRRFSLLWLLLLGTYIHWYDSPIPYKSAELSALTLTLMAAIAVAVLWKARRSDDCEMSRTRRSGYGLVPSRIRGRGPLIDTHR